MVQQRLQPRLARPHLLQQRLRLPRHPHLLRADQEEPENDENQQIGHQHDETGGPAPERAFSVCAGIFKGFGAIGVPGRRHDSM